MLQFSLGASLKSLPTLSMPPFRRTTALIDLRSFSPVKIQHHVRYATAAAMTDFQETANAKFQELGIGNELLTALAENRLNTPTEIQAAAIPQILRGGDLLLASHTGSGKTLAYLLPIVKILKDQEQAEGLTSRPKRPRALILGPTRELTDQILGVAKSLSHHARFRSACINGGGTMSQQAAALASPLDIVVGTPQKVVQHAEKGHLYYGDVQMVVLDEADTMFDKGFGPEVRAVLQPLRSKENAARCLLVLATLRKEVQQLLAKEFPNIRQIKTSSLHKAVSTTRHSFLPIPAQSNKLDYLSQVVSADTAKQRRVMVFCNTLDSCRAADHFLQERGFATCCYHGDVPLDGRREAIDRFSPSAAAPRDLNVAPPVFVCTDLAARGLDMPCKVDHIVNFDFPLNPVDYIHRAGRTARAGAFGRITSLVQKRDRVLASRIEAALLRNEPLDELSAKRDVLPPRMRPKPETLERRKVEKKAEQQARKGVRGAARFESKVSRPRPQQSTSRRLKFASSAGSSSDQKDTRFSEKRVFPFRSNPRRKDFRFSEKSALPARSNSAENNVRFSERSAKDKNDIGPIRHKKIVPRFKSFK